MGEATNLQPDVYTPTFDGVIDTTQFRLDTTPQIVNVSEMVEDTEARFKAAQLVGTVLGKREIILEDVEELPVKRPIESLYEGIQLAKQNNIEARKLVETNARTDLIERTIKSGIVLKPLSLKLTDEGKVIQHDQLMDSVHANSLVRMADHPIMGKRTEAETRNSYRIETLNKKGYLDEYNFVVFSLAEDLPEAGFFTETMTCAIQVTSKTESGLQIEPAFVSGVKSKNEARHDLDTIKKVYSFFGMDITSKNPAQILDTPLLVHKDLMPNGVIDLVKIWDDSAGDTFYGESKPREEYSLHIEKCRQVEASYIKASKEVADELIRNADHITTPLMAVKILDKLSAEKAINIALQDSSINLNVFGGVAAEHIIKSRELLDKGQFYLAEQERRKAVTTETSSSCAAIDSLKSSLSDSKDAGDGKGSLYFACPKCKHVNKRPFGNLLSHCASCKADVSCK